MARSYTNAREEPRLVHQILECQRKDEVDCHENGKLSALTRPDSHIRRNVFDFTPHIIPKTFTKVSTWRNARFLISVFMLVRDYELASFVRRVSLICYRNEHLTAP